MGEKMIIWLKNKSKIFGVCLFVFGALGYGILELLWRGHTHWTMLFAGGTCLLLYYKLCADGMHIPLFVKCFLGAMLITSVELIFGTAFNVFMGMDVWDYSNLPLHFHGQICLPFFVLWFFLCMPLTVLCNKIQKQM